MVSFIQLFVIAVAIASTYGDILNVTSDAQDYFLLSQRDLLHKIDIVDLKVQSVDARYADRLDVIQSQQQQVLEEIQQVNATLMPLQALSLTRKHCIQKFDSQLVTYDNAKLRLNTCYDRAVLTGNSLTTNAKSNVNYARSYATNTLPNTVHSCDSAYSKNQTALELCYIEKVDAAKSTINNYLNTANDQLDKALFDASTASKTAVQCSFVVEKNSLETIGQTTKSIDNCEVNLKAQSKASSTSVLSSPEKNSLQKVIMGKVTAQ